MLESTVLLTVCGALLAATAVVAARLSGRSGGRRGWVLIASGLGALAAGMFGSLVGAGARGVLAAGPALLGSVLVLVGVAVLARTLPAPRTGATGAPPEAGEIAAGEKRYRSLVERVPQAFVMQVGGRIAFANRAFGKIFGVTAADVVGRPLDQFVRPEHRELLARAVSESAQSPTWGTARAEVEILHPQGERRWVEVRRQIMEWEGSLGEVAFVDDITDRKRADEALRASEERYQLAITASQEVMYDWDVGRDEIIWNQNTLSVLGYEPEEMAHTLASWHQLIDPDDRPAVRANLDEALGGGGGVVGEYRLRRRDGTVAWVVDRGMVVRDDAGRPVRLVGAMTDITERKRLEERLRIAQKMEAVGHLGGGIAHDFNNLLTAIIGSCELLQRRGNLDADGRAELGTIHRTASRAAELTKGLLAFASRQVLEPIDLDLNEMVRQDLPILRRLIPENIGIRHVASGDLGTVHADPSQLEQVLVNLCVNARDAMPNGGMITVETRNAVLSAADLASSPWASPGRYVALAISDTGLGMSEEVMSHVFEPFFTTKEQGRGTGLGLATMYGIVKQHGGAVRVESAPGTRTSFTVFLPLVERRPVEMTAKPSLPVVGGKERILVVEDEPEVRRVLVEVLSGLGYGVAEASDGLDALDELETAPVDLIIADVVMPRMGGRELRTRVLARLPNTLFLFSSGYSDDVFHEEAVKRGGAFFIAKPYGIDALARKVREVLDSRRT
ncbi:MAG: PAS domain S-box protein [Acidobacteriota bacterium]